MKQKFKQLLHEITSIDKEREERNKIKSKRQREIDRKAQHEIANKFREHPAYNDYVKRVNDSYEDAKELFIQTCIDLNHFTRKESETLLDKYLKLNLLKFSEPMRRFDIKDGRYYDKDVMQRALKATLIKKGKGYTIK